MTVRQDVQGSFLTLLVFKFWISMGCFNFISKLICFPKLTGKPLWLALLIRDILLFIRWGHITVHHRTETSENGTCSKTLRVTQRYVLQNGMCYTVKKRHSYSTVSVTVLPVIWCTFMCLAPETNKRAVRVYSVY